MTSSAFFSVLERDRLGGQFAEDDVQRRDDGKANRDGHGVRAGGREATWQKSERRLDDRGESGFANPAEPQAGHGDAKLRRRNVAVCIDDRPSEGHRQSIAFGNELVDARLADSDDGELGGHEKAVREHQRRTPGSEVTSSATVQWGPGSTHTSHVSFSSQLSFGSLLAVAVQAAEECEDDDTDTVN